MSTVLPQQHTTPSHRHAFGRNRESLIMPFLGFLTGVICKTSILSPAMVFYHIYVRKSWVPLRSSTLIAATFFCHRCSFSGSLTCSSIHWGQSEASLKATATLRLWNLSWMYDRGNSGTRHWQLSFYYHTRASKLDNIILGKKYYFKLVSSN